MAQYQMYFGTQNGWTNFNVDIDEDEALQSVLPDVLRELEESGHVLKGWREGSGELVVTWEGRELDVGQALPQQGLRPNEVLRVAVRAQKPSLQLRRENEPHDVVRREELREGDDIIVGRTILRFHIGKQQKQLPENTTLVQRIRHAQIFHQTVYDMALMGGIAGLGCWSVVSWSPDFVTVGAGLVDVIHLAVLGGFIGGLTVGYLDHWLEDRVAARMVLVGIAVGMLGGVSGGLIQSLMSRTPLTGQLPLVSRALAWMIAGWLIGFGISLRWVMINKHRVLHGLIGGMLGGLLGGIIFWSFKGISGGVSQLLGFMLTGSGITCGVSLAPTLSQQGHLEFVSSGHPSVAETYGRSHKQWEIHEGGKYVIGSLEASPTQTTPKAERHIFIPDEMVAPQHATLISVTGRYYIEPHPELGMRRSAAAVTLEV
jgi:hypothetical protein